MTTSSSLGKGKVGNIQRHLSRFSRRRPEGKISKSALKRLARRGGVKRINSLIYDDARNALRKFLFDIIRDGVTYAEHARRKTITTMDVLNALKLNGMTLYH
jgi:histone H4